MTEFNKSHLETAYTHIFIVFKSYSTEFLCKLKCYVFSLVRENTFEEVY